jgi:hypothetical protein
VPEVLVGAFNTGVRGVHGGGVEVTRSFKVDIDLEWPMKSPDVADVRRRIQALFDHGTIGDAFADAGLYMVRARVVEDDAGVGGRREVAE